MRKWLIGVVVVIVAIGLGIGAAVGTVPLVRSKATKLSQTAATGRPSFPSNGVPGFSRPWEGPGSRMGEKWRSGNDWGGPGGMMGGFSRHGRGCGNSPWGRSSGSQNLGERITIDQAVSAVEAYLKDYSGDTAGLEIKEVMEFENNFYGMVTEKESGKGAFELLVDPYTSAVYPEPGPNMMWNLKYGHMRWGLSGDTSKNGLSLEQAKALAQKAVTGYNANAEIEGTGMEFYGYYTFDYAVNEQIVGMLSVNGFSGDAWFHNWHGKFISEKEM
ncbi:MAG: hypothetical protein MUO64_06905 [Anaerolineales bacterium]|nr:hypothetical protein [Anaerolineales bacterium]